MSFGFIGKVSRFNESKMGSFGQGNGFESRAQMLGINIDGFYETNGDGEKVLNVAKLMQAINEAESKTTQKDEEKAGQTDAFVKSTVENKEETKEVKSEKETIEKEYENAYTNFYKQMDAASHAEQQSKETADAWAEIKDMQFNLTKKGVSNATVIAGASEFITKLEDAIAATKAELKETEKYSAYDFTVDAQSDEDADLFKNNPFITSAFETSKKEKEIAVA
ncbi:hypothetical protein IJ425_08085 [bacterium]|nr:hypothetical protein [bacterium]